METTQGVITVDGNKYRITNPVAGSNLTVNFDGESGKYLNGSIYYVKPNGDREWSGEFPSSSIDNIAFDQNGKLAIHLM